MPISPFQAVSIPYNLQNYYNSFIQHPVNNNNNNLNGFSYPYNRSFPSPSTFYSPLGPTLQRSPSPPPYPPNSTAAPTTATTRRGRSSTAAIRSSSAAAANILNSAFPSPHSQEFKKSKQTKIIRPASVQVPLVFTLSQLPKFTIKDFKPYHWSSILK